MNTANFDSFIGYTAEGGVGSKFVRGKVLATALVGETLFLPVEKSDKRIGLVKVDVNKICDEGWRILSTNEGQEHFMVVSPENAAALRY